MKSIAKNLLRIKQSIPTNVTLVAVSKTKPIEDLQEAYNTGQRIFGENKIQEMVEKYDHLPKDIQWHMIGHLQSNKVKYMAHFVDLIHGVDTLKKLKEINKQAKIAKEDTKFGLSFKEIEEILSLQETSELNYIKIVGFMGMTTFTDNQKQIQEEFLYLKTFFNNQKLKNTSDNCNLEILSMGMSGDYKLAISNGSTMIRVGSSIFGQRN